MPLTPFTIENFGGLNLIDDPLEVGATGAVDMLNVWLPSGRLQVLPAITDFATATRTVRRVATHGDGTQVVASESDGVNTTLEAFNIAGASVATATYASASTNPHGFASIGTPGASRTYAVRTGDTTRRWDGAAWTAVGGMPTGSCAAPNGDGTRLAIGQASGNLHRVAFSTITGTPPTADPETFGANDYVDIAPGDGERICDLVQWRDLLFAFKNTKFAVFYGTSTDNSGNPVFNYRLVSGKGIGTRGLGYFGGACAAEDGVYFIGVDGIYRTTGGEPVLVSREIQPLFGAQDPPLGTTVPDINTSGALDIAANGRWVYVSVSSATAKKTTFVRQPDGQWLYWDIQANSTSTAYANFTALRGSPVYVVAGSSTLKQMSPGSGPSGNTINSAYKTGKYRLSDAGRSVVIQEVSAVGSGVVGFTLVSDQSYPINTGVIQMGVSPAVAEGWPDPLFPVDADGTWFQTNIGATNAVFRVHQLRHWISFVKPAGVF